VSLGELLPSDRPDPVEEVADAMRERQVAEIVAALPDTERNVIDLRFGLSGDEPQTIRQTGTKLGITPKRAAELEESALRRLAGNSDIEALRLVA
jgi:RNA polymerase primary sigma factor